MNGILKYYELEKLKCLYNLLSYDDIDILLSMNHKETNFNLALNSNLSKEQIDILLSKNDKYINYGFLQNINISDEIKQKIINDRLKMEVFK